MGHLDEDYAVTLELVRKLRKVIKAQPIIDTNLNPSCKLLNSEQLHLRGLARLIGPLVVAADIGREFRDASALGRELTQTVAEDPNSPVTSLLRDTQTHIRGCAQILANANAAVPPENDEKGYGSLFKEPKEDPRVVVGV